MDGRGWWVVVVVKWPCDWLSALPAGTGDLLSSWSAGCILGLSVGTGTLLGPLKDHVAGSAAPPLPLLAIPAPGDDPPGSGRGLLPKPAPRLLCFSIFLAPPPNAENLLLRLLIEGSVDWCESDSRRAGAPLPPKEGMLALPGEAGEPWNGSDTERKEACWGWGERTGRREGPGWGCICLMRGGAIGREGGGERPRRQVGQVKAGSLNSPGQSQQPSGLGILFLKSRHQNHF